MIARPKCDIFSLMIENPRIVFSIRWIYSKELSSFVWGGGCYRKAVFDEGQGCRAVGTSEDGLENGVRKVCKEESQSSDDDSSKGSSGRAHSPKSSLCNCEHTARCCCETESPAVDMGISELSEAMFRKLFNTNNAFAMVQAGLRSQAVNSNKPQWYCLPSASPFQMALCCIFTKTEHAVYEFGLIAGLNQVDLAGASPINKLVEKLCCDVKGHDDFDPRAESTNDLGEVDETADMIQQSPHGLVSGLDHNRFWFRRQGTAVESFYAAESTAPSHSQFENSDNNSRPFGVGRTQKYRAAGVGGNYPNDIILHGYHPKFSVGSGQGAGDVRENAGGLISRHLQGANFSGVDGMNVMSCMLGGRHGKLAARFTWSEQSSLSQDFAASDNEMYGIDWVEDPGNQMDTISGASDLITSSTYGSPPSPTSGLCSNLLAQESSVAMKPRYDSISLPGGSLSDGTMCSHLVSGGADKVIQGQGDILDQGEREVMYSRVPSEDYGPGESMLPFESSSKWDPEMNPGFSLGFSEEDLDGVSEESRLDGFLEDPSQHAGDNFGISRTQFEMDPLQDGIGLGIADDRPCNAHQQSVASISPGSLEQLLASAGSYADPAYASGDSVEKILPTVSSQEHAEPERTAMAFDDKKSSSSRNATYQVTSESPIIHSKMGRSQMTCPIPDVDCGGAPKRRSPRAGSGDGGVSSSQARTRSSQPSLVSAPVSSPPLLQSAKPEMDGCSKPEVSCSEGGENKQTQKNSTERKRPRRGGGNQAQTEEKIMYDDPDDCEGTGKGPGKRRHSEPNSTAIAERDRRRRMNQAFEALRGKVPDAPRRGKADLLECATRYISRLQELLACRGVSGASLAAEGKGNEEGGLAFDREDTQQDVDAGVQIRQQSGGACETSNPEKERNAQGLLSAGNEDSDSDVGVHSDAASTGAVSMDEDPVTMKVGEESVHGAVKVLSRRWVAEKHSPCEMQEVSRRALASCSAAARGKEKGLHVAEDEGSHPTSPSMASQGVVKCEFHIAETDGCVQRVVLSYPAEGYSENCLARILCQLASFKLQVRRTTMDVEKGWTQVNIGFEDEQGLSESSQALCQLEESLREIFFQIHRD
ncbi:bHLH transcription factor [Chara braunii]|uniref:BHLH transcription factor n=1 Tax=Chara braunii TaxID=69332 RepID=A0A388L5A6_CHABU|nr:bHLH transcription factor [Chara braunii]|eukprot:GBG77486.1 bHLH transcription factor [Chara braunii]